MSNSEEISSAVIGTVCLWINTSGFIIFYNNKSRKETHALLPNMIMFAFLVQAAFNYTTIVTLNYTFFFTNNPLPLILNQLQIYPYIIDKLKWALKIANVICLISFLVISLFLEILYCFESIHWFKNPITNTKTRGEIYVFFTVISPFIYFFFFFILNKNTTSFIEKFSSNDTYYEVIQEMLNWTLLLNAAYVWISVFSIPIINRSIKTQSIGFADLKQLFKTRHITYVVLTILGLIYPIYFWVIIKAKTHIQLTIFLWVLDIASVFGWLVRLVEWQLHFRKNKKQQESEFMLKAPEEYINNISNETWDKPLLKEVEGEELNEILISTGNDELWLSSQIMSNFLSESVFYVIKGFLKSTAWIKNEERILNEEKNKKRIIIK